RPVTLSRSPTTRQPCPHSLFLSPSRPHRDRHSFPTRRSSDLATPSPAPARWRPTPSSTGRDRSRSACGATRRCTSRSRTAPHARSEEHTSELQSRGHLVCRLLLEKKKKPTNEPPRHSRYQLQG